MDRYRKHDVILISDSNVRVRPSYLRETTSYLAEPGVGLVTNLFAGVGESHSGAIMENLQLNGFIAGGMALASVLRVTCVVGKSMLMPVRVLEAIGGFARVRNLLAEDQVIGVLVRKAGYSIRLSPPCDRERQPQARLQLVLEPAFAVVQDSPPDGAFHFPGRADGQPCNGGPGLGVLGRFGDRLGRAGGPGWSGHGARRGSNPLAGRPVPRLRNLLFRPPRTFSSCRSGSTRSSTRESSGGAIGSTSAGSTRLRQARVPRTSAAGSARVRKLPRRKMATPPRQQGRERHQRLRNLGSRLRFWSEDARNPRYPKSPLESRPSTSSND